MAKFLRDRGQTVVTSLDQKKILAEQADAKRRQEEAKQKEDEARAEAERQRQQEAEEDAQRMRKKLEEDRTTAKQLIEDAAAFLKYSRELNSPTTLAIAEGVASLNASVNADDVEKLEAATVTLSTTIHDDKNYPAFKQREAEDLALENARHLADAIQLLNQQKCFLLSYIAANATATASAVFIGEEKDIEARLSGAPDLSDIRPLTDKIDALIAQNGLHDRFAISVAGPCKLTPEEAEQKRKEDEARAEAERTKQHAAEEAARQAQYRLAKDQEVATQLIKDASDFLKYSREINSPTTLTIAQRIAALNGVLKGENPEKIESATTSLSMTINDDKDYADFKRRRSEELTQENARRLADVIQLLTQQQCFLLSYIVDNPTAAASVGFLGHSEEIKARLASAPDLSEIRTLTERIDASIVQNGLHDQFVASIASCKGSPAQAAAEAAKQAHDQLVKDQAVAKQLIDDASEFLKYSREMNSPNTLAIAQAIASLSGALNGDDAGKLEAARVALSETIHDDKNYADFSQQQASQVAQENTRRLADAIQLLKEQQCFLLSYIAEKPTAPESTTLVDESKEIETRLQSPDLGEIRPLTERIDASISQNSLHDRFETSIAGPCKTISPEAAAAVEAQKRQEETEREAESQKQQVAEETAKQFVKDQAVAKHLIDDASEFLKYSREINSPDTLGIAESIASLSGALTAQDAGKLEAGIAASSATIQGDKYYLGFKEQQAKRVAEENARQLADAIQILKQQQCFLLSYIVKNPTTASSSSFLNEAKDIKSQLSNSTELHQIRLLSDRIGASIGQNGLREQFLFSLHSCSLTAPGEGEPSQSSLPTTPQNDFLLKGDSEDVVLMFNASQQAPHVAKNLVGQIVFPTGVANACLYQQPTDSNLIAAVRSSLEGYHVNNPKIDQKACDPEKALEYDIVAVRRGDFLVQDRGYALSFLKELEAHHFQLLAIAPATSADRNTQLEAKILDGAIEGYGFVILTSASSNRVCATPEVSRDGHQRVVELVIGSLERDIWARPFSRLYLVG